LPNGSDVAAELEPLAAGGSMDSGRLEPAPDFTIRRRRSIRTLKRAAVEVLPHLRNSYLRGEKELNA
jgi:hypothetical protein